MVWTSPSAGTVVTAGASIAGFATWQLPCSPSCFSTISPTYDNGRCTYPGQFHVDLVSVATGAHTQLYYDSDYYCPPGNSVQFSYGTVTIPSTPGQYFLQAYVGSASYGPANAFTVVPAGCSLSSVAASVAASSTTLTGSCGQATLPLNTTCSVQCSAGAYLVGSAYACSTTGVLSGNQSCAFCPAGSFCTGGSAAPVVCAPGSYCPAGAKSPISCAASFALQSSINTGSSVALFSAQNVSWTVGCFADQLSGASDSCASSFAVTLLDAASNAVLATLFSASNYCPSSGALQAPVIFKSPANTYAGLSVYVQTTYTTAGSVTPVPLGANLPFTYTCTGSGASSVVPVQISGMQYTGATSGGVGSVLQVSALVPFTLGVGQVQFIVHANATIATAASCFTSTVLLGSSGISLAACALALPNLVGSYALSAFFSYQPDYCSAFQAVAQVQVQVLDAADVAQSVSSETARASLAETQGAAALANAVANITSNEAALQARNNAEAMQRASTDAALLTAINTVDDLRTAADAQLNSSVLLVSSAISGESIRAQSSERALLQNYTALSARVSALENATPSYVCAGRSAAVTVTYSGLQAAGYGNANQLAYTIIMDQQLAAQGADSITYSTTTGVLTLKTPGAYRLDAFIHLYVPAGLLTSSGVGTGVVAWLNVATGVPVGPNVLNPTSAGVVQGTPGDDTFVSTIVTVTAAQLPLSIKLTLLSMNQRSAQITDASVMTVTKLR